MSHQDQHTQELLELAKAEGFTLALHPSIIIAMENAGAVVNLRTGAIAIGGEQVRYAPTQAAQVGYSVVMTESGAYVLDKATGHAYAVIQPSATSKAAGNKQWRKQRMRVLVRDNFRCQAPGCVCKDLNRLTVHHIKPKAEGGDDDLPNLLTLCEYHHELAHRTGGQVSL